MKLITYLLCKIIANNVFFIALCISIVGGATSTSVAQQTTVRFDVNDVSFLWPVPTNIADVEQLISMDDKLKDGSPIWPVDLFQQVMSMAQTTTIDTTGITFPSPAFTNPHTWKVVGIRVNPASLGASDEIISRVGEIPGIRLVVQPVTTDEDGSFKIHDFAAHVVFNFLKPRNDGQIFPFLPNEDAFRNVVENLKTIKSLVEAHVQTKGPLDIHPGFKENVPGFRNAMLDFLGEHLNKSRFQVVSFMGIPSEFEPWIFFSVARRPDSLFALRDIGGFGEQSPTKVQMLRFVNSTTFEVIPAPSADAIDGRDLSTALLFVSNAPTLLNNSIFPDKANRFQDATLSNVVDLVANPNHFNTLRTDCVSCHTETTLRNRMRLSQSRMGIAFTRPDNISDVNPSRLPNDLWNVRNFGWGFNFFENTKSFSATITQRAANEAAESADFINRKYLGSAPTIQQSVEVK